MEKEKTNIIAPYNKGDIRKRLNSGEAVSYKEIVSAGFAVLFDKDFNRPVNSGQVKKLEKSFIRNKACLDPIDAVFGDDYDRGKNKYMDVDKKEQVLTPDSLVVLDGQHRVIAWNELDDSERNAITAPLKVKIVVLPKGMTASQWIVEKNTTTKNWSSKDRSHAIDSALSDKDNNLSIAREWQMQYGVGERFAYSILNFSDSYRKKVYEDYMNHPSNDLPNILKGTPENRERGKKMFESLKIAYRNHVKCLKNMASVNFVIDEYSNAPDSDKPKMVELLNLFFRTLEETVAMKIAEASSEEKESILSENWKVFYKRLYDLKDDKAGYEAVVKSFKTKAQKAKIEYDAICAKKTKEASEKAEKKAKQEEIKLKRAMDIVKKSETSIE